MKKILIIQLNRMGDIINTLPLVKTLKESYLDCFITVLCYREFSALFLHSPLIDRFLQLQIGEINRAAAFDELGGPSDNPYPELLEEYDLVINLAYDVGPAKLCAKLKAQTKYGRISSKQEEIRLLGDWLKYLFSFIHNRDYNLFSIVDLFTRSGGVACRPVAHYLPVSPQQEDHARLRLQEHGWSSATDRPTVALQLGASETLRAWEIEKFVALATHLKEFNPLLQVLLLGSPDEAGLADRFLFQFNYPAINLIGQTAIRELPGILKQCALLISNDTGPIHIAAAVGTQVLGIYFASAYFAETGPYGPGNMIVQSEMPCHPCAETCVCTHMTCRKHITAEAIATVAQAILSHQENIVFHYPHLSLYRSSFLANGTLIYTPFPGTTPATEFQKGFLYRVMWENENDIPTYLNCIEPFRTHLKNAPTWTSMVNTFAQELATLLEIFEIGITASDSLAKISSKRQFTAQEVEAPMNQLNIIEGFLDKREEPLSPIKHFFSFVIMDMDYLQLPPLAIELKKKYQKLHHMSRTALQNVITLNQFIHQ